jgi:lipoate-protein ligase A
MVSRVPEQPRPWFLLRSGQGGSARNMAFDEVLLETVADLGRPVLRFYSWSEPAASFGYFQKYTEIEQLTPLRPLVRRPTGGGLVSHDSDWTYSVAFPPEDPWYRLRAADSYEQIHRWMQAAFERLGLATELASQTRKVLPGQCFAGYEKSDLLWRGQKIAGAAQRRTRGGLLIQGSLQPQALQLARADWEQAMCDTARLDRGAQWREFVPTPAFDAHVAELAAKTYSQAAYNHRR